MIPAIKIAIMIAIILVLSYPFIPLKGVLRKFSVASSLKYNSPHNRKNIFFVLLAAAEFVIVLLIFRFFDGLAKTVMSIPFVGTLLSKAINSINSQIDYIVLAVKMVLINLIILYVYIFLKAFLKKLVLNPIFHIGKNKKKFSFKGFFKGLFKRKKKKKNNEEEGRGRKSQKTSPYSRFCTYAYRG